MNNFWSYPVNWLVAGLPLSAVLAGIVTLFIALAHPDPVVKPRAVQAAQASERPAVEGRNHVMTGRAPAGR